VNVGGNRGGIMTSVVRVAVVERPHYETPTIRVMTEQEILSSFQITQSMAAWWTTGACC